MRLSEAILAGSTLCKAKSGGASFGESPSTEGGCALDMANLAVGIDQCWLYAEEIWKWLQSPAPAGTVVPYCPEPRWIRHIAHRFDCEVMNHKTMTLEQFVDWVRSVEPAEEPIQAETEQKEAIEVSQ